MRKPTRTHSLFAAAAILLSCAVFSSAGDPAPKPPEDGSPQAPAPAAASPDPGHPDPSGFNKPVWQKPPGNVVKLGDDLFGIGEVRMSKRTRTVRFPVEVLMTEGAVEFLITTTYGKTHETVFTTPVLPLQVHLAVLLVSEKDEIPPSLPYGETDLAAWCRVEPHFEWKEGGESRRFSAGELVINAQEGKPLTDTVWVYTSSRLSDDLFVAQRDGTLLSVMEDPTALVNMREEIRGLDDIWQPNTKLLPKAGTKAECVLRFPPLEPLEEPPQEKEKKQ